MKKVFLVSALLFTMMAYADEPNSKVLKNFNDAFPKAANVTWNESKDDCQANFNLGMIKCKAWYDMNGNILKTIRYYTEEGLSPLIIARLKEKYNTLKVFGVTEINSDEGLTYYIILEDDKKWYHVTSDALGNFSMEDKYIKA